MSQRYRIGQTFDVWWELVAVVPSKNRNYKYVLRNKANGNEVSLWRSSLDRVANGEESVSRVISDQIKKRGYKTWKGIKPSC